MKKLLFALMFLPSLVHAGTITFYQNLGGNLGTINISSGTVSASCSGGHGSFNCERTITISSANVGGNLTNFPILLASNDVTLSTGTGGHLLNSSGFDIVFTTKSDCSAPYNMNWDTETVNNTGSATMNVWVNVPALSTNTLTAATFYMCYGNAGITTYQGFSTGTWNSSYAAVYHLANAGAGTVPDSTSNGTTLTNTNGATAATGQIDGAGSVALGSPGSYYAGGPGFYGNPITQTANFALSMWIKPSLTTDYTIPLSMGINSSVGWGIGIDYRNSPADIFPFIGTSAASGCNATNGVWQYISMVNISGTTSIYLNGAVCPTTSSGAASTGFGAATQISGTASESVNGITAVVDEAHFFSAPPSNTAAWIATEYNNQNSPSTFVTVGAEQ